MPACAATPSTPKSPLFIGVRDFDPHRRPGPRPPGTATPSISARAGFGIAHAIDADYPPGDFGRLRHLGRRSAFRRRTPVGHCGQRGARTRPWSRAATNIATALGAKGKDAMLALTASESNSYGVALLGGLAVPVGCPRADRQRGGAGDRGKTICTGACLPTPYTSIAPLSWTTSRRRRPRPPPWSCRLRPTRSRPGTFVNYETPRPAFLYQVFEPHRRGRAVVALDFGHRERHGPQRSGLGRHGRAHQGLRRRRRQACGPCPSGTRRGGSALPPTARSPRQPHRYSGRTAMRADVSVHEPKTTVDHETPFSYSMEGLNTRRPARRGAAVRLGRRGWNSNQSVFKFQQEVAGALAGGRARAPV